MRIFSTVALLSLVFFFSFQEQEKTPDAALKLMRAYPDKLKGFENNFIIWADGTKMQWDDGKKNKTYEELLNNADIEDMFSIPYAKGKIMIPALNHDPGRIRNEAFFKKMYGNTATDVKKQFANVVWLKKTLKQTIRFSKVNNAHIALQKVSDELDLLPDSLKKYLSPLAGTFNWRNIAGTQRLSTHSFGIAIDLNTKYSDYWLWQQQAQKGGKIIFKNRMPLTIVEIFEKYGFVWGGRWYHYDTMHFEYRPEMVGE